MDRDSVEKPQRHLDLWTIPHRRSVPAHHWFNDLQLGTAINAAGGTVALNEPVRTGNASVRSIGADGNVESFGNNVAQGNGSPIAGVTPRVFQ